LHELAPGVHTPIRLEISGLQGLHEATTGTCRLRPLMADGAPTVMRKGADLSPRHLYWGFTGSASGAPWALPASWRLRAAINSFWSFDRSSDVVAGFSRAGGRTSTGR
jgi:hypothetical protein